jgi:hypothetical protein
MQKMVCSHLRQVVFNYHRKLLFQFRPTTLHTQYIEICRYAGSRYPPLRSEKGIEENAYPETPFTTAARSDVSKYADLKPTRV